MTLSLGPKQSHPIFLESLSKDTKSVNVLLEICGMNSRYKNERMQKVFQEAMNNGLFKKLYLEHIEKSLSYQNQILDYSKKESMTLNRILTIYKNAINELGCLCEEYNGLNGEEYNGLDGEEYNGLNGSKENIESFEEEFYKSFEDFALKTKKEEFKKRIEELKKIKPVRFEDIGQQYEFKVNPTFIPTPPTQSCNLL